MDVHLIPIMEKKILCLRFRALLIVLEHFLLEICLLL